MTIKNHGTSRGAEVVSGNLQYFVVFLKSPNAFSDPDNATGMNVRVTGDIFDISQKNFEVFVQSIGLRSMPVIMNNPIPTENLADAGAPSITGEGFVWKFSVEHSNVFKNLGPIGTVSDVGFLVDELHNIVMPNGVVIDTKNTKNVEFVFMETI